jgi:BMFP domain-containing protein YqiC
MTKNSPFQSLPLTDLAEKAQSFAAEAVATTAELGRQTAEGLRGATAGSRQQVADVAVDALQETSQQLHRLAAYITEAAEPTAEQVSDALDQVVAWLDSRRDQLVAEVSRTRGDVETRFSPATRGEVAELEKRVSVLEGRSTKSTAKRSTTTKSTTKPAMGDKTVAQPTSTAAPRKRTAPKSSTKKSTTTKSARRTSAPKKD